MTDSKAIAVDRVPVDLKVEAPISAVLLMEDRAQVTRQVRVELTAGRNLVAIAGITPLLADSTLRCRIKPPKGPPAEGDPARLLDATVRRSYQVRTARPQKQQEIQGAIDSLVDEYVEAYDRIRNRFHERSLVNSSLGHLRQQILDRLVVGPFEPAWGESLDSIGARRSELEGSILADQGDQDDRHLRLGRLIEELRLALAPVPEYSASLGAELWVPVDGTYGLVFEYQVPCALWRPSYSAALLGQGEEKRVAWDSSGMVWQDTGEDWKQVALSLSTARPTLGAELPMLDDDRLSARAKTERERQVVEVESRDQVIAKTSDLDRPDKSDTPPGLDDGGEARTYSVPGKVDIPSDGRPHRIGFERWEAQAKVERVCLSEREAFVFTRSEQKNPSVMPLLAGPVRLVRNGGFVGRSEIRYVGAGETFALSWGSEDGLVVLREVDREYEETTIRKRRTYVYEVEVYLANHTGVAHKLRLTERVPVPEIEKVEVQIDDKKTTPGFTKDKDGLLSWQVDLKAGQEKRIELRFLVQMPQSVVWHG